MTKQYTLAEVLELQSQKSQLVSRLIAHKKRAEEKQAELEDLFALEGVKDINELSAACAALNQKMQEYAQRQEQVITTLTSQCEELDGLL